MAPRIYTKRDTVEMKLRVAPDVYDAIAERAEYEGRSMNQIAEKILAAQVKRWNAANSKEKKS